MSYDNKASITDTSLTCTSVAIYSSSCEISHSHKVIERRRPYALHGMTQMIDL